MLNDLHPASNDLPVSKVFVPCIFSGLCGKNFHILHYAYVLLVPLPFSNANKLFIQDIYNVFNCKVTTHYFKLKVIFLLTSFLTIHMAEVNIVSIYIQCAVSPLKFGEPITPILMSVK